ncbi:MAG: peptidoglycan -binding protein [Desulfobacterales bacterium]
MISSARRSANAVSVWPGYVDVLSALLMVVIFVLLIFTVSQFMLSEMLFGQENELTRLHQRVNELAELLGAERRKSDELSSEAARLSDLIVGLTEDREMLRARTEALARQSETDREEIRRQLVTVASLQEDIDALRRVRDDLESRIGALAAQLDAREGEIGALRDRSKALEARLSDESERTLLAQKEIEQKDIRIQALSAVVGEQENALREERRLTADARAELALLNRQVSNLRRQLEEISRALALAESEKAAQEDQIEDLGKRLNIALAREVNELQRYRSEFFGRLTRIIGDNPQIRIEGDRFVLQSELLFESGSASLEAAGREHLTRLAEMLKGLSAQIPSDIPWILRIDGHTDRIPIRNDKFSSNWELSTARAVSVVQFLAAAGIPQRRMAAAGFGEFHPIDPADRPDAYRKNRRIEVKLTSR